MQEFILIRGIPGSGKSTLAKLILGDMPGHHYEADMYFVDSSNQYIYDQSKIWLAHKWCQHSTLTALQDGHNVIVSNTFTTLKELEPYFNIAKQCGVKPNIILCQGDFKNIHDVPEEVTNRMKERFQYDTTPLFEKYFSHES